MANKGVITTEEPGCLNGCVDTLQNLLRKGLRIVISLAAIYLIVTEGIPRFFNSSNINIESKPKSTPTQTLTSTPNFLITATATRIYNSASTSTPDTWPTCFRQTPIPNNPYNQNLNMYPANIDNSLPKDTTQYGRGIYTCINNGVDKNGNYTFLYELVSTVVPTPRPTIQSTTTAIHKPQNSNKPSIQPTLTPNETYELRRGEISQDLYCLGGFLCFGAALLFVSKLGGWENTPKIKIPMPKLGKKK